MTQNERGEITEEQSKSLHKAMLASLDMTQNEPSAEAVGLARMIVAFAVSPTLEHAANVRLGNLDDSDVVLNIVHMIAAHESALRQHAERMEFSLRCIAAADPGPQSRQTLAHEMVQIAKQGISYRADYPKGEKPASTLT